MASEQRQQLRPSPSEGFHPNTTTASSASPLYFPWTIYHMHQPAGHWEDCYTRRLLFVYFFWVCFWISCRSVHYKSGGTTQQCAGTFFIFYNNGRNKQHNVSGKQIFISSSGFPPVSRLRKRLAPDFSDYERIETSTTRTVFAQTYTHKGRDPQQSTNKKVEIDHRAAPRRTNPRPLSLSSISSRRDIQPRGALRVVTWIDSCDGIRAPSSLSHHNQRRRLYSACR